jgi:hypothetical protein
LIGNIATYKVRRAVVVVVANARFSFQLKEKQALLHQPVAHLLYQHARGIYSSQVDVLDCTAVTTGSRLRSILDSKWLLSAIHVENSIISREAIPIFR